MLIRPLLTLVVALALVPSAHAVELGAADDLNLTNRSAPDVLESMKANGVEHVRVLLFSTVRGNTFAWENIERARELGLGVQVVLTPYGGFAPGSEFPAWAAEQARRLADLGVDRVSILNEPDLWLPAIDACDTPQEVAHTVRTSIDSMQPMRVTKRVKRYRWKRVRRKHRRGVYKRRGHRLYKRKAYIKRVFVTRMAKVTSYEERQEITKVERKGCLMVHRARMAVETWRSTIPAIRAVAPNMKVLVGETSPCAGVKTFVAEAQSLNYPRADGWAHHPYWDFELGLQNAAQLKVREPVYWTEFGTPVRTSLGPSSPQPLSVAKERWGITMSMAQSLGVKQVVAYGWFATGGRWDTAAEDVLFSRA